MHFPAILHACFMLSRLKYASYQKWHHVYSWRWTEFTTWTKNFILATVCLLLSRKFCFHSYTTSTCVWHSYDKPCIFSMVITTCKCIIVMYNVSVKKRNTSWNKMYTNVIKICRTKCTCTKCVTWNLHTMITSIIYVYIWNHILWLLII